MGSRRQACRVNTLLLTCVHVVPRLAVSGLIVECGVVVRWCGGAVLLNPRRLCQCDALCMQYMQTSKAFASCRSGIGYPTDALELGYCVHVCVLRCLVLDGRCIPVANIRAYASC